MRNQTPQRQDEYLARLRACGLRQRDVALLWRCTPSMATLKLNGYKNISPDESKKLDKMLKSAEKGRGK